MINDEGCMKICSGGSCGRQSRDNSRIVRKMIKKCRGVSYTSPQNKDVLKKGC